MKTLIVSTMDIVGGASRSAYRLHDGLRRTGHDSHMYVGRKASSDPCVHKFAPSQDKLTFVTRNLRRLRLERQMHRYDNPSLAGRTFFTDDRTCFARDLCRQIPPTDLINLHWVSGFVDYGAFFEWLPPTMPLVWTLHDMSNFTGGCCYDLHCDKFTRQCGACPQLGSRNENDLSRQIRLRKEKYYAALNPNRFHIVTPSRWLAAEVHRSPILSRFPCSLIPYGLDLDVFQPRDRTVARDVLGVPQDAKVILFVSDTLDTHRKGFHLLTEALASMPTDQNIFLLYIGGGTAPAIERFPNRHIAGVSEDRMLSLIYSAADLFVAPSIADNLPNTILEAIGCGTPCVAFDAGGMPDMVRPGITGSLASAGNIPELATAILTLLNDSAKRQQMSANCRAIALAEYNLALQATRYIALYGSLIPTPVSR